MSRRHSQQIISHRILDKMQVLIQSPLHEVGARLSATFGELQTASNFSDPKTIADSNRILERMVDLFPVTYGQRFYFDAAMIQATADSLSNQRLTFNPMILPLYGNVWGHQSLPMPSHNKNEIELVDFILFPGQDDLAEVNLLSYPFLLHELGHNIYFRNDHAFRSGFKEALECVAQKLTLSTIADQGAVQLQARQNVESLRLYWEPKSDQRNWAYELAIDIMAVWLGGPAYLAAFIDETDKPDIDPFSLQDHPPYELRAKVIIQAARNVGLENRCDSLTQLLLNWRGVQERRSPSEMNRYRAISNDELIDSCVRLALEECRRLELPQCTETAISRIADAIAQEAVPEPGIDVIIAAWLAHHNYGDDGYQAWQSQTISELQRVITQ